jgi:hypothetical protein
MKSINVSRLVFACITAVIVASVPGAVAWGQIPQCTVTASPGSVDLGSEAQTGLGFTVLNGEDECFWKVTAVVDGSGNPISWLTVTNYSWALDGEDTVTYSVSENVGFDRTGFIWIDDQQAFQVNQAGACTVNWQGAPSAGEVFVAYPACGAIVKVNGAEAAPLYADLGVASYQGLVYGPDEKLYALDATRGLIDVFNSVTPGDPLYTVYDRSSESYKFDPAFARFNQTGALIVSGADSLNNPVLYIVGKSVPVWVGSGVYEGKGALGGISFDADGAILAVLPSTGQVLRFPLLDAASGTYGDPSPVISGLTDALGDARTANRDVFVATRSGLQWFEETGAGWAVQASSCFGGQVLDVEQTANDTLNLTVWNATAGQGELWEVPFGWDPCPGDSQYDFFCGGANLLAIFGAPSGSGPAAVGVALPFTGREAFTGVDAGYCDQTGYDPVQGSKPGDLTGGGQSSNFFDAFVEFIPSPVGAPDCRVTISSTEHSPFEIEDVIFNETALQPSTPLVLPGDNGRMRVFKFVEEQEGICPPGDENGDPLYTRNISAFFKEVNPKLALCHAAELTNCNLQLMSTLDLEFGNIPDDGKIGGFDPQFSEAFLVDQVPPGGYDGKWCGIDPPVQNEDPWLQANAGSVVPIDIKPVLAEKECGDKTIPDLVAVLNVWYIPANGDPAYQVPFEDLTFTGNGSGSDYRAQFFEPSNPRQPYSLNWDTTDRNGDPLPTGDYKLTIFDDSAATLGVDKVYFPPQSVHIILK